MYKLFQLLPVFKGKIRLAKFLFYNKKDERTFKVQNDLTFTVPNITENVSLELMVNGIYEPQLVDYICTELPPNGIYIDVGANVGALALQVAKKRSDVKVYAFEAAPSVFAFLKRNNENNDLANLFIYNLAIHTQDDTSIPFYSPMHLNGKGSFAPVFTQEAVNVTTISLDTFFMQQLLQPNLIKIDVEGFEYLVLLSMKTFLKDNTQCKIVFEFVDWAEQAAQFEIGQAQDYIIQMDYQLKDLDSLIKVSQPIKTGSAMLLATKNELKK